MGNTVCCGIINKVMFGPPPAHILFLGLDAVGKTTMLYKLKLNETFSPISTCGFNVETVRLAKNTSFTIWDVGGGARMPPLWRQYYAVARGVVYIVDASDSSRFNEAKGWLDVLLESDELAEVPILLLANKQDLPNAVSPSEVAVEMGLNVVDGRVRVRGTCAMTGEGLQEAMMELHEWIRGSQ